MGVAGYKKKLRDVELRRRTRFVFICAEGNNKTETNYFRSFNSKDIQFKFVSGKTTDPINMSKDLIEKMGREDFDPSIGDCAFCLIDGDNNQYKDQQIETADVLASRHGFQLILSNPCFEVWFLCHYSPSTKQFYSSEEVIKELRQYLPKYSKADPNIKEVLSDKLLIAIDNAKKLESFCCELRIKKHTVAFQPCTEVYKIIEQLKLFY